MRRVGQSVPAQRRVAAGTVRARVARDASGGHRRQPGIWGRASGRGCARMLITPLPGFPVMHLGLLPGLLRMAYLVPD
jgi:hypothetical protein